MADITPNIGLKKPLGNESADIAIVNENMDKIDQSLGAMSTVPTTSKVVSGAITELRTAIDNGDAALNTAVGLKADTTYVNTRTQDATTSAKGVVQLNNTTNSTSTTQAATANAVKLAYDAAILARTYAP